MTGVGGFGVVNGPGTAGLLALADDGVVGTVAGPDDGTGIVAPGTEAVGGLGVAGGPVGSTRALTVVPTKQSAATPPTAMPSFSESVTSRHQSRLGQLIGRKGRTG